MKEIIEKIQKILRLSESANQHEAELAAQKAQELLSKHNLSIDAIDLERANASETIDKERFEFKGTMRKWRERLMLAVIRSVDCDLVWHQKASIIQSATIYGLDQNVKTAMYMYMYLENTIDRLRKVYIKEENNKCKSIGVKFPAYKRYELEKSYTLGIVKSVRIKLESQKIETPPTPGALVPIVDQLIESVKNNDFGKLKPRQARTQNVLSDAFNRGKQDGENIIISKRITNTQNNNQLAIE